MSRFGVITPAAERPRAAIPIARPRRRSNHFESTACTTSVPAKATATERTPARSTYHCQSSVISASASSAPAAMAAPIRVSPRPP
ncbi:MAG: hypothetical protein F4150_02820 [Chloroflexi bacterium]|nr:hypothetical protein [Chloroflexota bacterium]